MQPSVHMSDAVLQERRSSCRRSGAQYCMVNPPESAVAHPALRHLAKPKSTILTMAVSGGNRTIAPSRTAPMMTTFAGFRSRWMTPAWCK